MCVLLLFLHVGAGPAAAQGTAINMSMNGEQAVHGDEIVVLEDPNANITISAETRIDLIELRVNGDTYRSYSPNSTNFDRSLPLELDPNDNTVEIIAKADGVTTLQTAVTKYTAAPSVRYTSPFSTTVSGGPNSTINVTSGQITLAGDLHTLLDVKRIRIERTTNYGPDNSNSTTDRRFHRISNPGESFSQDLLLANGKNEIVAEYTDSQGRTNTDRFTLIVDDKTDPVIEFDVVNETYTDTVRISGTVQDQTKLKRVEINRTSNNGSQVLMLSGNAKPNPDRLSYEFDTTVELYNDNDDNVFQITAEDTAGNIRNRTLSITYDPEPEIQITDATTDVDTETVRVTGKISEAEISRVTVETVNSATGDRLDIVRVYDAGGFTDEVSLDQKLTASRQGTIVNVLVVYRSGQYSTSITAEVPDTNESIETNNTAPSGNVSSVQSSESANTTQDTTEDSSSNKTTNESDSSGEKEKQTDKESASPTLLPIRTREAFGGIVIVGGVYLFGHWV
ncbi:hypothetical protein EXE46_08650 [Halorubrum sp. GN11_10-6_MGM]|uniref:hypothetical protein n=1 Tax=Halorubrum sp. GN11_10-6_MGM TaxID=2518112 RepID=UPI00113972CE|nr:hypothetical protein [Halorubrum sp. GN11_10-6_MGM]TKX74441.1 hypothetical protein EXE46_08650 [Halorubrum sp. GN11_10-6_MGM]